jgi:hypothetical protein
MSNVVVFVPRDRQSNNEVKPSVLTPKDLKEIRRIQTEDQVEAFVGFIDSQLQKKAISGQRMEFVIKKDDFPFLNLKEFEKRIEEISSLYEKVGWEVYCHLVTSTRNGWQPPSFIVRSRHEIERDPTSWQFFAMEFIFVIS